MRRCEQIVLVALMGAGIAGCTSESTVGADDTTLTSKGRRIAKGLNHKHEVIKRFFINVLEVNEETADKDACDIEHVISDETLDRLVEYLESLSDE